MRRFTTNRELVQMIYRSSLLALVLGSLATTGCWQQLDSNASSGLTTPIVDPDAGIGGAFPTMTQTPAIAVTTDPNSGDPTDTTTDPCVKTIADALAIRQRACSMCHEASTPTGKALGDPLDHILEDDAIINVTSPTSSFAGWKYVVPGDPENSLIYHRVAVVQDMPKKSSDPTVTSLTVSISEMSVLRSWIMCLGNAPAPTVGADGGTH